MNITHSIDGYIARTLIRYCNYNIDTIEYVSSIINIELYERMGDNSEIDQELYESIVKLNLLDLTILEDMHEDNLYLYHTNILRALSIKLEAMLSYKPFVVLPTHDCFKCHPNNMNVLRYWYNEILAELSNSTLLANIISQLLLKDVSLKVFEEDIADEIRKNDYAIN